MKRISITSIVLLVLTVSLSGQNKTPKWIAEKCAAMKEQVKADLSLTAEEADTYHALILEKISIDSEEIKKLESDDAKKEYRVKSSKVFGAKLKEKFGAKKGQAIQKWTSENQAKFNNPNN